MDDDFINDLLDSVQLEEPASASSTSTAPLKPAVAAKSAVKPAVVKAAAAVKPAAKAAATKPAADSIEAGEAVSKLAAGKFRLSSIKEAIKAKGMWAGAVDPVIIPDLQGAVPKGEVSEDDEVEEDATSDAGSVSSTDSAPPAKKPAGALFRPKVEVIDIRRPHTPALLKSFDELIVNASDHAKEYSASAGTPPAQRVTRIDATFDVETGRFVLENDGPGIPVVVHEEATQMKKDGAPIYVPEVAFSIFLAGTNIDKDPASIKGGTNGLGAKIANVHSQEFIVETVDPHTRRFYSQRFRDRLDVIEPPTIVDLRKPADVRAAGLLPESTRPHTTVSYQPTYAELGYKMRGGSLLAEDVRELDAWLRLRLHQTAAYVGDKVVVTYNGDRCETTNVARLGRLLANTMGTDADQAVVLTGVAKATEAPFKAYPWELAVIVLPAGKKVKATAAAQNMTLINGVVSNKGAHVQYIRHTLSEAIEVRLRKATKSTGRKKAPNKSVAVAEVLAAKSSGKKAPAAPKEEKEPAMSMKETLAGVRLVMCSPIPWAGRPDWTGQRKDELTLLVGTAERYTMTAAFLKSVADTVTERILMAQHGKTGHAKNAKHTKAKFAKTAKRAHTYLMAAEGDSAITLLKSGLTQKRKAIPVGGPSLDWCGIVSLQGVIPNAAREVSEIETTEGETISVCSQKLRQNERLMALAEAFGLREDRAYETAEEQATLNYGKMLLCVDQDLDGTGKIAPLVLVWLHLFWPALIRDGKVGRFMTPLVRCYPKAKGAPVVEFFYETELHHWLAADESRAAKYTIKYYKGLATHNKAEGKRMFRPAAFQASIYTYTLDDVAAAMFRVHFGPDPSLRKAELVTPVAHPTYEAAAEMRRRREIPVGAVQLNVDTKLYKNEAIKRQIAGGADGLNPARRKILAGAIHRFANEAKSKELKIYQLGGYVADKMFYHHGETSLNGTIVYLAQTFPGARRYPYLLGEGQFGNRHGDKAGSARYIAVKQSPLTEVTFPPKDRWHLSYVEEDGERAEPRYFVPVAPMAALESYRIVSEGWNHDSYGRSLDAVLAVTRAYIGGDPDLVAAGDALHAGLGTALTDALELVEALAKRWPLPPETRGHGGEVRFYRGEAYSFGAYVWTEETRTVTITELPMGVTTAKYLKSLVLPGKGGKANMRGELIEAIHDRCSENHVELEIVLKPGAFAEISEKFGAAAIDPVEDALLLRSSLRPHLNYYSKDGGVLEFGECYLAAILYWAPLRRDLYQTRVGREHIVARLRILEEENVLRYIPLAAELDLSSLGDDEAAARVLQERGFLKLNTGLLHRPEYTPNEELEARVLRGSYDYILDLKERELVQSAVVKRQKRLQELRADQARAEALLGERPTPCASLWLQELEAFLAVVRKGIDTDWRFEARSKDNDDDDDDE
jgi:DNA topoisomerase II